MIARLTLLVSCAVAAVAQQQFAAFAQQSVTSGQQPVTSVQQTSTSTQQTASTSTAPATIIKYVNENNGADGYYFEYLTSDGTFRTERGVLQNRGTETEAMMVTGRVSWVTPEGQRITLDFVADQNGYRPVYS